MLPTAEVEFPGHEIHDDSDVAPVSLEYDPWTQYRQGIEPLNDLYFPASHATHDSPLAPV